MTPEPAEVDAFLREVCDIPAGWPLGDAVALAPGARLGPSGDLALETITQGRVAVAYGFIAGDASSRQFQVLHGSPAGCWAVCISTRDVEGVHARAAARGVPCTPLATVDWSERDIIRYFFCSVGGITFEVMRVEPKPSGA